MGELLVERKVYHLGSWHAAKVDNSVIKAVDSRIAHEKGNKVTLHLNSDGLRVYNKSVIHGRMLFDQYISKDNLKYVSVNRRMPDILIVVSMSGDPIYKYQIQAFRCKTGIDANIFLGTFGNLQKTIQHLNGDSQTKPSEEEINWTLRSKEHDNSKRELNKLVDMHGEPVMLSEESETKRRTLNVTNGHTEVIDHGIRIPVQQKQMRVTTGSLASEYSDTRSDISESALRVELESLSQEVRDIKVMLEKSTGVTVANSKPRSPRSSIQYYVKNQQKPLKPNTVIAQRNDYSNEETIDAIILQDEPVQMQPKENGYTITTEGGTTHVRISVPDYRSTSERSTMNVIRSSDYERKDDGMFHYHPKTTSYENWKVNTMERNAVQYNDLPERIQWQSRPSRASYVVGQPRATLSTWSADRTDGVPVQVRHRVIGVGPGYQRAAFGARVVNTHDRRARAKPLSTTVLKPIEQVYAKHHSLSSRSNISEVRPTILGHDNVPNEGSNIFAEHNNNNNNKKADCDEQLLDVSGIDLYKEASTEGITILT